MTDTKGDALFVIWSYEHEAWWRPDRCGYVTELAGAGRYSAEEAGEIVTDSVLLGEIAIKHYIAAERGKPPFHPYDGKRRKSYR